MTTATSPLHVNLYAGPGVGKSTTALGLAYHLKRQGVHCELVNEAAKAMLYRGTLASATQAEIFKAQCELHTTALLGQADVIVSDSPIPLTLAYCTPDQVRELQPRVREFTRGWDTLEVLLTRDLRESYQQAGRYQSCEQAMAFAQDRFNPWAREYFGARLVELEADDRTVETLLALVASRRGH